MEQLVSKRWHRPVTVAAAAVGAVLLGSSVLTASAATGAASPVQYTGCLKSGNLNNVAVGTAPASACVKPAVQITWNQTGPTGDPGSTGPQGPAGATGATGPQGATGSPGPKGDPGAIGPQGLVGATGAAGTNGKDGAAGPVGPVGPAGPQGVAGPGYVYGTGTMVAYLDSGFFGISPASIQNPVDQSCNVVINSGTPLSGFSEINGVTALARFDYSLQNFASVTPAHYTYQLSSHTQTISVDYWIAPNADNTCTISWRYLIS